MLVKLVGWASTKATQPAMQLLVRHGHFLIAIPGSTGTAVVPGMVVVSVVRQVNTKTARILMAQHVSLGPSPIVAPAHILQGRIARPMVHVWAAKVEDFSLTTHSPGGGVVTGRT